MTVEAYSPDKAEQTAEKIAELAKLSPIQYDQCRKAEAEKLNVRINTLDAEVACLRDGTKEDSSTDIVEELEPWNEPVNGNDVLNEVARSLEKHVTLPAGACSAVTLWLVGTYCMDAWRLWPKLLITSPEKRCGKSTLLEAMEAVSYRAFLTASITASALFRCIEAWKPTLLIDEADTFAKDNDELNGIVNAGHTKRTATVVRTEKVGDGFEPRRYKVWCPQVIAGIKRQRDTLHDRSIHIQMCRKMPGESVERMPLDYYENNLVLRRKILRWALDNLDELKGATPEVPNYGNDRAQDNWTPLFVVAGIAGGLWPEKVKAAYKSLTDVGDDTAGIGPMILSDIKTIFDEKGCAQIFSDVLVAALTSMEERPWCEWRHGRPLTKNSLARLLRPFGVTSGTVRVGAMTAKGYKRTGLEDAWNRYLAPITTFQSVTTSQLSQGAGLSQLSKRHTVEAVTFQKTLKASQGAVCDGVTFQNPGYGKDMPGADYPPGLFDAAAAACGGLKLTASEFISELELADYPEIISDPVLAKVTAKSMSARK
ncbi:DNA primase [hydrothermal vent metagenome]|uniref:DNA primase n=1 Tax=hydrothermal vent metagenome TaxID=652676 RepID=A0A3B0Y3P9_9ZZZZ